MVSSVHAPSLSRKDSKKKFHQKKWFWILLVILSLSFGVGAFLYKTGYVLNKISDGNSSIFGSLWGVIPVGKADIEQEDGRTNVLLLGMRGQNIPGGGLLADTIMIVSLKQEENKVAMISIPRDLYVRVPGTDGKSKVNGVYAFGEEGGKGEGPEKMRQIVQEISGLKIHYVAVLNFTGFKKLVDTVGGVEVTLDTPFYETHQFVQGNECGGQFILPQGKNNLSGEQALCYVRARENTSDFDRAKRQQLVLKALKDKLVSLGTLADFTKVNGILNAIGENFRTDMNSKEMIKMFEKYSSMTSAQIYQRVLENTEEGFLTVPSDAPQGAGYILIPRAGYDNYSQINEMCRSIFDLPPQSDIQPVKQYSKPAPKTEIEEKKPEKNKKEKEVDEDEEDK